MANPSAAQIMGYIESKGYSHKAAAAMVGSASVETGGTFDPTTSHDGGKGIGLFAHQGSRRTALQALGDEKAWERQVDHAMNEIATNRSYAKTKAALANPDLTVAQMATVVSEDFERPDVPHLSRRISEATKFNKTKSMSPTMGPPQPIDMGQVARTARTGITTPSFAARPDATPAAPVAPANEALAFASRLSPVTPDFTRMTGVDVTPPEMADDGLLGPAPPGLSYTHTKPDATHIGGAITNRMPGPAAENVRAFEGVQRQGTVTSAMRHPSISAEKGVTKSSHNYGEWGAIDVSIAGMTAAQKAQTVANLSAAGFRGIGTYDHSAHIHADMNPRGKEHGITTFHKGRKAPSWRDIGLKMGPTGIPTPTPNLGPPAAIASNLAPDVTPEFSTISAISPDYDRMTGVDVTPSLASAGSVPSFAIENSPFGSVQDTNTPSYGVGTAGNATSRGIAPPSVDDSRFGPAITAQSFGTTELSAPSTPAATPVGGYFPDLTVAPQFSHQMSKQATPSTDDYDFSDVSPTSPTTPDFTRMSDIADYTRLSDIADYTDLDRIDPAVVDIAPPTIGRVPMPTTIETPAPATQARAAPPAIHTPPDESEWSFMGKSLSPERGKQLTKTGLSPFDYTGKVTPLGTARSVLSGLQRATPKGIAQSLATIAKQPGMGFAPGSFFNRSFDAQQMADKQAQLGFAQAAITPSSMKSFSTPRGGTNYSGMSSNFPGMSAVTNASGVTTVTDDNMSFIDHSAGASNGDGGEGSTVLCTHYHRIGWLPDDVYAHDTLYGMGVDDDVWRGYHQWAIPLAKRLETSPLLERVFYYPVRIWAEAMHRPDTWWSKAIRRTGEAICRAIATKRRKTA